ncbi:MAG: hypothetical protein WKF73_15850 [Nocardioidaceae bacterium]
MMASISKREVGGKPRYDVNYREPDGRRRRKTFLKKSDAERFTATVEADKARGSYLDPDAGKVTLKRYADQWLAAQTFDVTSRESVEMHLRLHVYPVLGGKQIRAIKPSTIQAWLRGLTMSSTYQRMILGNVSSIFNAAVDDELVTRNPCRAGSVRTPRLDPRKVVPWPVERVGSVRDALADRYRVVATLAAGLGLRQGEVFGLAVEDVDFLRGTVKVRRQVRLFSTGGQAFRLPKGRKDRTIPLPELGAGRARGPPCVVPGSARLPAVGHDRGRAGHGRAARHDPGRQRVAAQQLQPGGVGARAQSGRGRVVP